MKRVLGLVLLATSILGEAPPPYPYKPSGWRPQGPAFELPSVESNSHSEQNQYLVPQPEYKSQRQNINPQIPSTRYGVPAKQITPPSPQAPSSQYGPPHNLYGAPSKQVTPQNNYGAPQAQQQAPQNQYGTPTASRQQLPQNQYGAPTAPQNQYGAPTASRQQLPQNQYGAPTAPQNQYGAPTISQQQIPQNQYSAPTVPQQLPQNEYGAPKPPQQTEINLTPQQQQFLLTQLIKLQQLLSSQKRQQVPPLNEYGAPTAPFDVRSGGVGNTQNPLSVEPLNGDQLNIPNTQYLPSFNTVSFRSEDQSSFRNQNNAKRLSFSGEQNQEQDGEGYKTIVLTKEEEDDYNKRFGAPPATPNPPVKRERPESSTEVPGVESNDENFEEGSGDPNVAVATAVASGRYYLLLPDGRLQRVVYKTTQSEEEAKINGFTANLMYQLVEPIKDPIYTVDGTPYVPVVNQN